MKYGLWAVWVLACGLMACDGDGDDQGASVFDDMNTASSGTPMVDPNATPGAPANMMMPPDGTMNDDGMSPSMEAGATGMGPSDDAPPQDDSQSPSMGGQPTSDFTPTVSGEEDCGDFQLVLKPRPAAVAKVILMVDRSPSMVIDGDLWTPMRAAVREVTTNLQGVVDFGLMLFPNPSVFMECAVGEVNLAPQSQGAEEINRIVELYAPAFRQGGTPTAESLQAAGEALEALNPNAENNYILLATDGGPGCNSTLDCSRCDWLTGQCFNNANCLDDLRTIDQVLALSLQGIKTFVVSIPGAERFSEVMDRMAIAGNTAVDGRHFEVTDIAELGNALRATTGSLVPCEYEVLDPVEDIDSIVVTIDGEEIPHDRSRANGWDFFASEFHFYGDACSRLRDGAAHGIRASYDCGP